MLNIIQNTIGAIRRVGESVVRAGLKMWLPFTKAEPLGEELVTNGDFATDSDWSYGNGWDIDVVNNKVTYDGTGQQYGVLYQVLNTIVGNTYKMTFTLSGLSGGTVNFGYGTGAPSFISAQTFNSDGTYTIIMVASITDHAVIIQNNVASQTFSIDNVSVEEYAQETPDISGNDNNAILKTGKCLTFTGNDSVQTAFPSSKDIKTIAFWIYPTHSSTDEVVFYFGDAAGGDKYIDLDHLVMESDANNNINFDVYIDGVLRGETNYGGNNPTLTINQWQRVVLTTDTAINTTNDKFYIAHRENGAFGRFNMSDLQIYGAEFTTDDIAYDYANPQKLVTDNASSNVTLNDLHAWWHMSEGDGTIAFDSAPLIGKEFFSNYNFSQGLDTWEKVGVTSENVLSLLNGNLVYTPLNSDYSFNKFRNTTTIYEANKTYRIEYKIIRNNGLSNLRYFNGNTYADAEYSVGTHIINFKTSSSVATPELYFWNTVPSSTQSITFEYISAKEVYNIDGETYDGSSLGATYDDAQERIPQLGMMNWSKGSNLFLDSEPTSDESSALNITYEDYAWGYIGFKNATKYGDNSVIRYRYGGSAILNKNYTVSAFVIMDDGSEPDVNTDGTGDFSIVIGNNQGGGYYTKTNVSGNIWRIRKTRVASATSTINGIVKYTTQSSKGFRVVGWQIEESPLLGAYRRTDGTAVTDATLISCATDSQKDILGNAVRVKGSGFNLDGTGYAINETLPTISNNISLSFWVKLDTFIPNNLSHLIGRRTGLSWLRVYRNNANSLQLEVAAGVNVPFTINENQWVFVTATIDSSNQAKIYVDGGSPQTATLSAGFTFVDTDPFTIGAWLNPTLQQTSELHGLIDDVQIYNRVLDSDEIEQNYKATKSGHNN